jgi:hypothetical protein
MASCTLKTTRWRYMHDGPTRYDDDSTRCVVRRSVLNLSPQKAEIERCFEILHWFVPAQVRKQVLHSWSWLGNIPFYMPRNILVIQERARFHTFLCLVSHVTNECAFADDVHIHLSMHHLLCARLLQCRICHIIVVSTVVYCVGAAWCCHVVFIMNSVYLRVRARVSGVVFRHDHENERRKYPYFQGLRLSACK